MENKQKKDDTANGQSLDTNSADQASPRQVISFTKKFTSNQSDDLNQVGTMEGFDTAKGSMVQNPLDGSQENNEGQTFQNLQKNDALYNIDFNNQRSQNKSLLQLDTEENSQSFGKSQNDDMPEQISTYNKHEKRYGNSSPRILINSNNLFYQPQRESRSSVKSTDIKKSERNFGTKIDMKDRDKSQNSVSSRLRQQPGQRVMSQKGSQRQASPNQQLIHQNLESPDYISHGSKSNKADSIDSIGNNSESFGLRNKPKVKLAKNILDKNSSNPPSSGLVETAGTAVFNNFSQEKAPAQKSSSGQKEDDLQDSSIKQSMILHTKQVEEAILENYKKKVLIDKKLISESEFSQQLQDDQKKENSMRISKDQSQRDFQSSSNLAGRVNNTQTFTNGTNTSISEEQMFIQEMIDSNNPMSLLKMLKDWNQQQPKCLDLLGMKDQFNFTLLSYAAFKNETDCFKIIFEYCWKFNFDKEAVTFPEHVREWVDTQNNDGFNALHFASQYGNFTILTMLVEKAGASILLRNKFGATVMHLAAQKDQCLSIYYFYTRGIDINIRDPKNCTPLHWAVFTRSEMAVNYILALKPNLEAKDIRGLTPLHLSINRIEKNGSARIMKTLLLKGANRLSEDFDQKTPVQWIPESLEESQQDEIKGYLKKPSYCECVMVRLPLVPLKRNYRTQILLIFLLLSIWLANTIIILPTVYEHLKYVQFHSTITTFLVILTLVYATCKSPGIVKPQENLSFLQLLKDINPADLCPECRVIKTARSRHCAICDRCVERYDHHCPWINNCVGIKNHNAFMLFLFSMWIKIVYHICFGILSVKKAIINRGPTCDDNEMCHEFCIGCDHLFIYIPTVIISLSVCFFFLMMSSLLLYTHIRNYFANRTTNERLSSKKKGGKNRLKKSEKSSQKTQDEQGEIVEEENSEEGDEDESTANDSSIMTYSDFTDSKSLGKSLGTSQKLLNQKPKKKILKRRGRLINLWKMATHTKIVPQDKLYKYLAESTEEIGDEMIIF